MKIAYLMDPLESIQPENETTSHLMYECNERGHAVYFLEPHDVYIRGGQVVARMDIDDLNAQLQQNQANLAEAEAQLQDLLQGTDRPQLAQAEANLEAVRSQLVEAEARLRLVEGDLERDRNLYTQGAISARELDNSQNAVESALANFLKK